MKDLNRNIKMLKWFLKNNVSQYENERKNIVYREVNLKKWEGW